METIHAERNLYPGVNAHLNSYLQVSDGGLWETFHTDYITYLRAALDAVLPPGYFALSEKSLQIGTYDPAQDFARALRTRPDVTIFRDHTPSAAGGAAFCTLPTFSTAIIDTIEDEDALTGIVIYRVAADALPGHPVTRIELLSPSNKPGGSHFEQYTVKRVGTLKSGLRLVELDFLHLTHPVTRRLPSYASGDADARPYVCLVSDPRPSFEQGTTDFYTFGVVDPLPRLRIPLAEADVAVVDLSAVYDQTFSSSTFFKLIVDYAQEPPAFERFLPADRETIRALLDAIRREWAR